MTKEKLTYKLWAKILAYFLLALCAVVLILSGVGIVAAWETGVYTADLHTLKDAEFRQICISAGDTIAWAVHNGDFDMADNHAVLSNAEYRVTDHRGAELWKSQTFDAASDSQYRYTFVYIWEEFKGGDGGLRSSMNYARSYNMEPENLSENEYVVEAAVDPRLIINDQFYWINKGFDLLWTLRFAVYVIVSLALLLGIACFVFLLCGAGHRSGHEELVPGYLYRVPFDLMTAALLFAVYFGVWLAVELTYDPFSEALSLILIGLLAVAGVLLVTGWCSSFAMRVKLGKWWRNTVIYWTLHLLWRFCCRLWRGVKAVLRWVLGLLRGLPLIWKTALGLAVVSLIEMLFFVNIYDRSDFAGFWVVEKMIFVVPVVLYLALSLRKLQKGGEALAAGDLGYQTDTRGLLWDLKKHAENLNSIGEGMTRAVEERTRSERLKTELITNVSHDIKTPLTSIINYVDLMKRSGNPEKQAEYLDVLDRQSRKLKKLTEDLVEMSKASTGNLEVDAGRHSVSELLRQVLGEYSERLWDARIEAVLTLPEKELFAHVDGTLLWRVVDNLFSNACKYAQSGTRFYIDAAEAEGKIKVSFKNISRERLNVPADELLERFVRGDSARGGEGSGLGLNIAQSLTELQGGEFALSVDGDLFKVELTLPQQK